MPCAPGQPVLRLGLQLLTNKAIVQRVTKTKSNFFMLYCLSDQILYFANVLNL